MKEITPERFRCAIGTCPAVFETGCSMMASCPAVLPEKNGKFIIIGTWTDADEHPELAGRIGEGECAIEIDAELVREALNAKG